MTPSDPPVGPAGLRVLVVEDEPILRRYFCRVARQDGHPCRDAATAEDALALLEAAPADLVISDVQLPKMNGCALIRVIARRWPSTRVLLITGYLNVELVMRGDCEEGMPLLIKPFAHDAYRAKLAAVLAAPPWTPMDDGPLSQAP